MTRESNILALADSHFTLHLLGPDEPDIPPEGGEETTVPLPENLVEDFADEVADMVDEVVDDYAQRTGWERPLVYGFADGVLAVSDGSWSTFEDSYFEDVRNPNFSGVDAEIDRIAADFEGSRPWDEAAKGYVRSAVTRTETDPSVLDQDLWATCAHGFFYGADAAYDQEWKIVVTPAGNLLLTDEDSIAEAAHAQMQMGSGSGSLMDRLFNLVGIDPDELKAALAEEAAEEAGEEAGEPVEAEVLDAETVK